MPVARAALDVTSRAALKEILAWRPDVQAVEDPQLVVEMSTTAEPPVLVAAKQIEGGPLRAIPVGAPDLGFAAFLDGTQRARVLAWSEGVPYVLGTVAAAIRVRRERRLSAWDRAAPLVENRLYMPLAYAGGGAPAGRLEVVDTTAQRPGERMPSRHPAALIDRAIQAIQRDRERLEQRLALQWDSAGEGVLCADGPLPADAALRASLAIVGVVKSHRTLYAEGDALRLILTLRPGERSTVFALDSGGRETVASWYLRTRASRGRDSMWGLVRLESSLTSDVARRADAVSRWLLAENAPLALPDRRWDKMTYGVRDCEEFLRAIS